MGELTTNRTAEQIAAEINSIKDETKRVVIYNSIEIGRKLTEAKELVPAGQWGEWLEHSVDYKKSTANNLMRIFKEYGADQLTLLGSNTKNEIYDKLNYSQATILLGLAEEEKEEVIKNNDIEEMSSRELKKVVDELKKEKKAREEAENKVKKVQEESEKRLNEANKLIEDMIQSKQKEIDKAAKVKDKAEEYKKQIEESNKKIDELNKSIKELENRPIEVTGIDEDKKALEEELERAKAESEELRKRLEENNAVIEADDATQRYAIYFADIEDKFDKLLGALKGMKEVDRADYKMATDELLKMMRESFEKI